MQAKKAAVLREEWGDKPCEHPNLAKEYAEGVRTGEYVCTQCGARLTFRERVELLASRKT
jgi:DNA-directed RNA polymerase subunit RPC12/RpoP